MTTLPTDTRTQQRGTLTSQETSEWYTPAWCIGLVRQVLGNIDLDPASNQDANAIVQARYFYGEQDNGLALPWRGKVFLNPPYNGNARQWSRHLVDQYETGNVTEAILLVFAKVGYTWFEELFDRYPVVFVRERIRFVSPTTGDTGQAKHASSFVYFGPSRGRFRDVFCQIGRVFYPEDGR